MRLRFVNCGISEDSSSGMLGRLNQDVFSNNATIVTLSAGMNDVGLGLYSLTKAPDDAESRKRNAIDALKQNIERISDALTEKGVRQILITPTIYDEHVESTDESMRGANWNHEHGSDPKIGHQRWACRKALGLFPPPNFLKDE
jgi:lysophospholipase L1-like esterase